VYISKNRWSQASIRVSNKTNRTHLPGSCHNFGETQLDLSFRTGLKSVAVRLMRRSTVSRQNEAETPSPNRTLLRNLSLSAGWPSLLCKLGLQEACLASRQVFFIVPDALPSERVGEFRSASLNHRSRPVAVVPPVDPDCGSNPGHPELVADYARIGHRIMFKRY
jgi:hypothetical protein